MGQVLHGSATTTETVRRALQRSEESVRVLARRYGVSPTTVQKWRKRETVADQRMGPAEPRSTTLSLEEEAMVVAFRRHTLLPLDEAVTLREVSAEPMFVHMNGNISATTLSNEDMARGEAVRWIGISLSAGSMIALFEGHSPSVVDRGPSVPGSAHATGLKDGEVQQIHD